MSQKIRIKLKSYDYNLVDKSADKIVKTVKNTGAIVTGPIPLPTHKKIFTYEDVRAEYQTGQTHQCKHIVVGVTVSI